MKSIYIRMIYSSNYYSICTSQSIISIFYFRGEIKDKVSDVVPSFDLLIPKPKDDILEDVSFL